MGHQSQPPPPTACLLRQAWDQALYDMILAVIPTLELGKEHHQAISEELDEGGAQAPLKGHGWQDGGGLWGQASHRDHRGWCEPQGVPGAWNRAWSTWVLTVLG